jgi:dipeptidyl aminopeptidase/acylaminoacyl peptidase
VRKSGIGLVSSAALVLLVAVVGSLVTGESRASSFVKPKPARNGLIAYSYAGDIYVGDPVTGETTRITTNPRYEVNPVFSPNGKRIAFIRGDPQHGGSTIVVVRVDGSDERVLVPKRRKHRGFDVLAWTPDGASLVAQLDACPMTSRSRAPTANSRSSTPRARGKNKPLRLHSHHQSQSARTTSAPTSQSRRCSVPQQETRSGPRTCGCSTVISE